MVKKVRTAFQPQATLPIASRERLLQTAKQMFVAQGFDNTSTAAIAKAAGTSESQLVKHFASKEGLLEAIFDDGWRQASHVFPALEVVHSPAEKLLLLFELMANAFQGDPAWGELLLTEGRRVRKDSREMMLPQGYLHFVQTIDGILQPLLKHEALRPGISGDAARSALIGMVEGMLRDQLAGAANGFSGIVRRGRRSAGILARLARTASTAWPALR